MSAVESTVSDLNRRFWKLEREMVALLRFRNIDLRLDPLYCLERFIGATSDLESDFWLDMVPFRPTTMTSSVPDFLIILMILIKNPFQVQTFSFSRGYSVGVMDAPEVEALGRIVSAYLRNRAIQVPVIPQVDISSVDWRLIDSLDLMGQPAEQYKEGIKQLSRDKAMADLEILPY